MLNIKTTRSPIMRFIGITKDATTAGPGKRLELFLKGCIRGIVNPCEGCFNPSTWEFGGSKREMHVDEVVDIILQDAWNNQVTFCGGEPLLQTQNLIEVCRILKEKNPKIHIVIYTAYTIELLLKVGIRYALRDQDPPEVKETLEAYSHWETTTPNNRTKVIASPEEIKLLMKYIDILVDGDYQSEYRIPTEKYMNQGMFIGSANQKVIDTQSTFALDFEKIIFKHADVWMDDHLMFKHCKCCGHPIPDSNTFCNTDCEALYEKRIPHIRRFGGSI